MFCEECMQPAEEVDSVGLCLATCSEERLCANCLRVCPGTYGGGDAILRRVAAAGSRGGR